MKMALHIETSSEQIEGLHDAVRTYTCRIWQHLLVSFCTVGYEENNKKRLNFQFTSWKDLKFHLNVCDILVIWLELVIW